MENKFNMKGDLRGQLMSECYDLISSSYGEGQNLAAKWRIECLKERIASMDNSANI